MAATGENPMAIDSRLTEGGTEVGQVQRLGVNAPPCQYSGRLVASTSLTRTLNRLAPLSLPPRPQNGQIVELGHIASLLRVPLCDSDGA